MQIRKPNKYHDLLMYNYAGVNTWLQAHFIWHASKKIYPHSSLLESMYHSSLIFICSDALIHSNMLVQWCTYMGFLTKPSYSVAYTDSEFLALQQA